MRSQKKMPLLFTGCSWSFDLLGQAHDAISKIALDELKLDIYPNQIEIISAEQMLDAYSCAGLPLMYQHWSFGKRFVRDESNYRQGRSGLAYEIVINSNPCISYNMEENSMAMQILVMSHAAFGHNHFFKNNYLFRDWTDASSIHDYLAFAKSFIAQCEQEYGDEEVEAVLDAAHALQDQGVFRYGRVAQPTTKEGEAMQLLRDQYANQKNVLDLWTDRHFGTCEPQGNLTQIDVAERRKGMQLPEENILYFLEKHSPILKPWQRQVIRIVRFLAQYLYPQKQTKVINEGCATFVHHYIINRLYETGQITQGTFLEIIHNHTNVVAQPEFDSPRFSGINPYALGFAMMEDIRRICENPTREDREWFPTFAGNNDWASVLRDAWRNYRDDSFILQFLSPHLIRKFKLFAITDNAKQPNLIVSQIHNREGYRNIRRMLAKSYDIAFLEPDIQVVDANMSGDRELKLNHTVHDGIQLETHNRVEVLRHIKQLWGYEVRLTGRDQKNDEVCYESTTATTAV